MFANQVLGPTGKVGELRVCHINPHPVIERGENLAEMNRTIFWILAPASRRTDHLAALHPASRQQGSPHIRPVVTAAIRIDFRRASEFTPGDNGNFIQQPALIEILDHGGQPKVKEGKRPACFAKAILVPVPVIVTLQHPPERPAAKGHGHAPRTRFNHPPRQEKLVQVCLPLPLIRILILQAISSTNRPFFLAEVKCIRHAWRSENIEGLLPELVDPVPNPFPVSSSTELVKAGQQGPPVSQPPRADAIEHDVATIDRTHFESGVRRAKITGLCRRCAHDETCIGVHRNQVDGCRYAGHTRSKLLGQHRAHRWPAAWWKPRHQW